MTQRDNAVGSRLPEDVFSGAGEERSVGDRNTVKPRGLAHGRIDQYELVRELGGGGFGVVYLARDTVAGVDVAVKGLPPLVKNNAEELEAIRENFALVSKLHHPHIAAALHLHQADKVAYADERARQALRVERGDYLLVMAFAPGVTLSVWRKQFPERKVGAGAALEIGRQIAEALDYAHGERIVHRDIKPANVMVETREKAGVWSEAVGGGGDALNAQVVVRVLDFGLAAEIRSSMSRVSQDKGDTSGTRPYMAPEQWSGRKQDGRTDQYALAVLCYELLSGSVPFASAFDTGDPVIMANAAQGCPPAPLAVLSKAQNQALLKALAKDPARRHESCRAFIDALGGVPRSAGRKGPLGRQLRVAVSAGVAAAAVAAAALAAVHARQARSAAERAVAEQAAKRAAERREMTDALRASAEAAVTAGDLDGAGAKIAELKQAGVPASAVVELQKRLEAKASERAVNRCYAEASLERERAQALDREQGIGAQADALEVVWREAEAARQGGGWGQALSGYGKVIDQGRALAGQAAQREGARACKVAAEQAKSQAAAAKADKEAQELFEKGGQSCERAAAAFAAGDWAEASNVWAEAAGAYASAQRRAAAVQAFYEARSAFDEALEKAGRPRLEKYGGAGWKKIQAQVGKLSASSPEEGRLAYGQALALLPDAVKEVEQAQREEQKAEEAAQARRAAEAERLAAKQKAAAEKAEKQKALADSLGVAQAAWDKADYGAACRAYGKILEADPDNAVAQTNRVLVDAQLTRLNPIRSAKKGDWWRRSYTFSTSANNIRMEEVRVTEVDEDTLKTLVIENNTISGMLFGSDTIEKKTEVTKFRNALFSDDESSVISSLTNGKDSTDSANSQMAAWKKTDRTVNFTGCESVRIGSKDYLCKCVVVTHKNSYSSAQYAYANRVEIKYWISESAPTPILKESVQTQLIGRDGNPAGGVRVKTLTLSAVTEENVVVGGQPMRCVKEVRTGEDKVGAGTSVWVDVTETTWRSVECPWLGAVRKEVVRTSRNNTINVTHSEKIEAFGSRP